MYYIVYVQFGLFFLFLYRLVLLHEIFIPGVSKCISYWFLPLIIPERQLLEQVNEIGYKQGRYRYRYRQG